MLINTSSKSYKVTRAVIGFASSLGGAVLAGAAIKTITPSDMKTYQKVAVKVATIAVVYSAGDLTRKLAENQVDEFADIINGVGEAGEKLKEAIQEPIEAQKTRGE